MSQKEVRNCQYVCSMNPTSGSFIIDERLQHHFVVLSCFMPNAAALVSLFSPILQGHFNAFDVGIQRISEKLLECTVEVFKDVADTFLPTTQKFFYQFSLRDIVAVASGLCSVTINPQIASGTFIYGLTNAIEYLVIVLFPQMTPNYCAK